jgi:hypothetical protein
LTVLRKATGETVPKLEIPGVFKKGIERGATKTKQEAWLELGDHGHEGDEDSEAKASGKTEDGRVITWRTGDQIKDRVPEWAWKFNSKGRLQRGTLVLFAGRPGAGKSTGARWFASGFSNGTLDGCFIGQPQNVAYIASEESVEDMIKPSMRAHGADHARIYYPKVQVNGQEVRLLSIVDEEALTKDLIAHGIKVVFVDPVMSTVHSKVNINANNEVRAYLEPWARIARAIDGLVIGIVHLTKAPGGDIVAAITSSSAFGEVARGIIAFAKDQQSDDGTRVLSQEKNSAGPEDLAMEFKIESKLVTTDEGTTAEVGRFVLGDVSDRRVADVLQTDPASRNVAKAGTKMAEVLEAVRRTGEPVTAAVIGPRVDISKQLCSNYLNRLADAGLIRKLGHGLFDHRDL